MEEIADVSICTETSRLDEAIDDLVMYSLMNRKSRAVSTGSQSFWIHPLVQHWARESTCEGKSIVLEHNAARLAGLRREGARAAVRLVGCGVRGHYSNREPLEWVYERENMTHLSLCFDKYISKETVIGDDARDEKFAVALF